MTDGRHEVGAGRQDDDQARGLAQLEGYLLWNAELAEARSRAGSFADRLPWLTAAQREEVEQAYTADRLALSRSTLSRIADRAAQLRTEYEARYRQLKLRCVATCALTCAGLVCAGQLLSALTEGG